jgi:hypothetical protein
MTEKEHYNMKYENGYGKRQRRNTTMRNHFTMNAIGRKHLYDYERSFYV